MATQADYIQESLDRARRNLGPDALFVKQLERQLAGTKLELARKQPPTEERYLTGAREK